MEQIVFSDEDLVGIFQHDDDVVVILSVANAEVRRVLIDTKILAILFFLVPSSRWGLTH